MRRRQFWLGLASLVRPLDLLGIGLYAAAAAFWTGYEYWGLRDLIAYSLGFVLIAAGGYAYNDYRDIRIDAINRPGRPLIRGTIKPRDARLCAIIASWSGVVCLWLVSSMVAAIGLSVAAFLYLYSYWLKGRYGFLGNILLSAALGLCSVSACIQVGRLDQAARLFGVVFGLMLSREVVKDLEDHDGDRAGHRATLATTGQITLGRYTVLAGTGIVFFSGASFVDRSGSDVVLLALGLILAGCVLGWFSGRISLRALKHALKMAMFGFTLMVLIKGALQ